MKKRI
jgi:hypothetical protein